MVGRPKEYTEEELLSKLSDLYNNWGDTLSSTIRTCDDMPCLETYAMRFGSITDAREMANVKKRKYNTIDEEIAEELRELERCNGRLSGGLHNSLEYKISKSDNTLTELKQSAGLIFDNLNQGSSYSNILLIEELRNLRRLGIYATKENINMYTTYTPASYQYVFGLSNARRMAGYNNCRNRDGCVWTNFGDYYTFEEWANDSDSYDPDSPAHVYRLRDESGRFYVGQTEDMPRRIGEHPVREGFPLENLSSIYVEPAKSVEDSIDRERELFFETSIEFDTVDVYGGK